jgi:4,5:9,10-diseco-3-hydroxy-5,9,17-trioxoandrosta-1(10),2-diene-4-oate hydrolase
MREGTVRVDGLNIRYLEEGEGSPILLLHGGTLGFSGDVWRGIMPALAKAGHRVVTYDQPGFGLSDAPPTFGMRYRQDFIAQFLDALGIERPLLVGHSQAGGLVVPAVLATPEKFRGVIVMGTGSLLPPLTDKPSGGDVDIPEREPTIEETRALLQANLFHHALITPELLEPYHQMSIGRNFENAVQRAKAGGGAKGASTAGQKPLWQRLDEMTIPSLFIYGANDRASAAQRVGLARERFPTLTYHLLDHCHHIIQWDQPDALVRLILDFETSLPR